MAPKSLDETLDRIIYNYCSSHFLYFSTTLGSGLINQISPYLKSPYLSLQDTNLINHLFQPE